MGEPGSAKEFLEAMALEATGEQGRYRAGSPDSARDVVFGGQLLAQAMEAALIEQPQKRVRSIHMIFSRPASVKLPLEVSVETPHAGRSLGSATVTFEQRGKVTARGLLLLDAGDPDLIRHATPAPAIPGPGGIRPAEHHLGQIWEMRVVGGADVQDPDDVRPAELPVWTRWIGAPDDPVSGAKLLAYASDGFLIGAAMLPHPGIGQSMAHVSISTGVLSHTLSFHEPFTAGEWLLMAQESAYAGGGRCHGRAHVYREDGSLVASFSQDSMIRGFPEGQTPDRRPPGAAM